MPAATPHPSGRREPHHGVMLNTGPLPFGKRGASYQMTRRCKAFLCLK
ncbi:hypothetical protein LTSEALA_2065 [Salmonella enterica subsp. enterica serovar Alachua str. R6-377]|uniref:Uncharacterized protein n=1 Tax=Salmonella enterica subsp. enterica serovar Alachua str. R6-377 TaxID=913241 RepID=G5LN75_SALET|nr:hypothetical protein LTSEALA_2065 [Salmonella enterica subsp. enterica serovar Alachua str. R6-377]